MAVVLYTQEEDGKYKVHKRVTEVSCHEHAVVTMVSGHEFFIRRGDKFIQLIDQPSEAGRGILCELCDLQLSCLASGCAGVFSVGNLCG